MASEAPIQPSALADILKIRRIVEAALSDSSIFTTPDIIAVAALTEIGGVLDFGGERAPNLPYGLRDLDFTLQEGEYIIPKQLKRFHESFLKHIASGKDFREFGNTGLALHGEPGNGKSEYPAYLNSLLSQSVDCYKVDINLIRESPNPVEVLNGVYDFLGNKYKNSDRYALLLMDEWDQAFSTKTGELISSKSSSQSGSDRSTQSIEETTSFDVDTIGTSIVQALKMQLNEGPNSSRVFTITTTNKKHTDVPPALLRAKRLHPLKLSNPFSKPKYYKTKVKAKYGGGNLHETNLPRYSDFYAYIMEMIDIFITIENRTGDTREDRVRLLEAYKASIQSAETKIEPIVLLEEPIFGDKGEEAQNIETVRDSQQVRIKELLRLLGCKASAEVLNEFAIFGGISSFDKSVYPEVVSLARMSRSDIAKLYINLRKDTKKIDKKAIQRLISGVVFPQTKA